MISTQCGADASRWIAEISGTGGVPSLSSGTSSLSMTAPPVFCIASAPEEDVPQTWVWIVNSILNTRPPATSA